MLVKLFLAIWYIRQVISKCACIRFFESASAFENRALEVWALRAIWSFSQLVARSPKILLSRTTTQNDRCHFFGTYVRIDTYGCISYYGVDNNNSASQIWSPCKSNFSENINWPRKSTTESLFSCDTLRIKAGTREPRTKIGTPSWLFRVDFKSGLDNKKWVSTENF